MSGLTDARHIAKKAAAAGCDVTADPDRNGVTVWTATHPNHPELRICWTARSGIKPTLRRLGDALGDKVLAGRVTRRTNSVKAYRHETADLNERRRQAKARERTRGDVITRRAETPTEPTSTPLLVMLERAGYSIDQHAIRRIIERGADTTNILRALLRPDIVRPLKNGHRLHATATCKLYVDPKARRVLTVV